MSIWSWLLALHILCAVIWVGGMFFAYVIMRPSLSVLEPPQRLLLHTQVFRRFFLVVWHVMPLLLISGFILVFGLFGGMANVPWNIQAMMGIGIIMAVIFVVLVFGPYARFRRTTDRNRMAANIDSVRKLIGVNLVLGLITVVIAALSQF
ncbi:MAG TPA: CopD family protein [Acetobacteraceae bacterium]|nr:CopD family protein [Acetobacteraceae bacterium]